MERITHVAVRVDGEVYHALPPNRHHNVLQQMDRDGVDFLGRDEQGFLTSASRFVDRLEAMEIAKASGQLKRRRPPHYQGPELFSEDLW